MNREEIYARFEELDKRASLGGGVDKIEKQHASGRMTARERIDMLLDKGTFNELDKFVTHRCTNFGMEKKQIAGDGMVTLPAARLHAVAARLKEEGFDFLRSLTGMDWGEEGLGVVYHLESTRTGENLVLRTLTPDRENPVLDTVCDLWRAAEFNEREAYDYFGIRFLNHPDMRRLFLRDDWVGYLSLIHI